jgi:hypothetical protein
VSSTPLLVKREREKSRVVSSFFSRVYVDDTLGIRFVFVRCHQTQNKGVIKLKTKVSSNLVRPWPGYAGLGIRGVVVSQRTGWGVALPARLAPALNSSVPALLENAGPTGAKLSCPRRNVTAAMLVASTGPWVLAGGSSRAIVGSKGVVSCGTRWQPITAIAPAQGPDDPPWPRSSPVAGCVLILQGMYASPTK